MIRAAQAAAVDVPGRDPEPAPLLYSVRSDRA